MGILNLRFNPIEYHDVLEMEKWKYNGFEKAIFMDRYHESQERGDNPLKGPRGCFGYSVYSDTGLFGLMEYYFEEDGVYLGLALNPIYVGQGFSREFIGKGVEFLKDNYTIEKPIKIEVHRRNIQGVKAYEKCGFKLIERKDQILIFLI